MAMGKRKRHAKQSAMWVATQDLPRSAAHPFYTRLNQILDQHDFDGYVEDLYQRFDADDGRPGLSPGRCFRLLRIGDKGYHSNQSLVDLETVGVRSYISEPDRGRRNWTKDPAARDAVYRSRRRIRGARGQRLLRLRGERLERPFAHLFETGAMRRVDLRGHTNIRKRLLLHTGGFNLALLMRHVTGVGTPRSLEAGAPQLLARSSG